MSELMDVDRFLSIVRTKKEEYEGLISSSLPSTMETQAKLVGKSWEQFDRDQKELEEDFKREEFSKYGNVQRTFDEWSKDHTEYIVGGYEVSAEIESLDIPQAQYLRELVSRARSAPIESRLNPQIHVSPSGRIDVTMPVREQMAKIEQFGLGTCIICGQPIAREQMGVPYGGYYAHYECFKQKLGLP